MCTAEIRLHHPHLHLASPHRRHCLCAFDHVRGRRFPSTQIETLPRKAGACPLSNRATEFGLPMTRRPLRVEAASEGDVLTTRRPMRVEAASEGDVLTTRRLMRGEAASEGDCLTPGKKKIYRNARLVGRSSWGRGRRDIKVAGASPAELDHRRL